jgi:hypothetical protein
LVNEPAVGRIAADQNHGSECYWGEIKVENGRRIITVKPGKDHRERGMLYDGARMRS